MMKIQKAKILCVCAKGLNRSKYLAEYLKTDGYETRYGGLEGINPGEESPNPINQEDVDWADAIIIVRRRLEPILRGKFNAHHKKVIVLDITDSERLIKENHPELAHLTKEELNKKVTYPALRKAIKSHLPLKLKRLK